METVTGYGLNDPGSNPGSSIQIFLFTTSKLTLRFTQPPIQWEPKFISRAAAATAWIWPL